MEDSLEIIKSERDNENDLTLIKGIAPVISITRIDNVPKISPTSRNTDFSIENLLRKDCDTEKRLSSSPKVKVTRFTPAANKIEPEGDDGIASVTSSNNSNCSSDIDEDFINEEFGSSRGRKHHAQSSRQDIYHKQREFTRDREDGGFDTYQTHHTNSDNDSNATVTSSVAQQILAQSKYLSPEEKANLSSTFSWLTCTRFKPPKLPRSSKKRAGCKRYGRGPRIPFAPHQIAVLESTFSKSQYLSSDCIHRLADTLHLSETRVKIWFQNRRARYRREKEPQLGQAATMQLQQSHASPHQMRNSFRKNQLLLTMMPSHTSMHGSGSPTSPKPTSADAPHENTSPFSSSGGSDVQTDLDLQDHHVREAAAATQRSTWPRNHHPHMLMSSLIPFQLHHEHAREHQQQLHDYYLELNQQQYGRSASNCSNGSGNDESISISTSPLLHSALQPQPPLFPVQNLSTTSNHHSGGSRNSHSPSSRSSSMVDNYSMYHRQQQYFNSLLRGNGPVPFGSPMMSGAPNPHGMQLSFPPAVKYT